MSKLVCLKVRLYIGDLYVSFFRIQRRNINCIRIFNNINRIWAKSFGVEALKKKINLSMPSIQLKIKQT